MQSILARKIQHGIIWFVFLLIGLAGLVISVTYSRTLSASIAISTIAILLITYFLKRYLPDANTVGTLLIPEAGTNFAQQAPVGKNGEVLISYANYTTLHRRLVTSLLAVFMLGGGLLIGFRTLPVPTAALFAPTLIGFACIGIYALYSLVQLVSRGARLAILKSLILSDPRQAFARYAPKESSGALRVGYTTYKRLYKIGLVTFGVFVLLLVGGLSREILLAQSVASQNFRAAVDQVKVVINTLTTGQGDLWQEVKRLASQSLQPAPTIDENSITQKIVAQLTKNLPAPATQIVKESPSTQVIERSTVQENSLKSIELSGNGKFVIKNNSSNTFVTFGEGSAVTFENESVFDIKGLLKIGGTTITATPAQLNGIDSSPVLVAATDPNISGERVLEAGDGIVITDYGANKNLTVSLDELKIGTTDTNATSGSILFAGSDGVLQQDNDGLYWNNSDNKLGIGTTSPSGTLDVRGNGIFGEGYLATTFGNSKVVQINSRTDGAKIGYELYDYEGHNNRRAEFFLDDSNGLFGLDSSQNTSAADFVLRTQGIERLRVKGVGGFLGLGTSSPVGLLTLANSSSHEIYFTGTETASIYQAASGSALNINSNGGLISIGANGSSSAHLNIISSGNVGIGTSSPSFLLDAQGPAAAIASITGYADSASGGSFLGRKARGTQSSPTKVLADDKLSAWGGRGYVQSSGFQSTSSGRFQIAAAEDYTSTSNLGSYMIFETTPIGSGTIREVVRIDSTGSVGIGTTSFGTSGTTVLAIGNGTAPTTSIADGVQLYAEDVASSSELKVRDEAGNVTTLSPHNFSLFDPNDKNYNGVTIPWSFYSRNEEKGQEINVDMLGALQAIEQLSGQQFVYVKNLATGTVIQPKLNPANEPLYMEDIDPYIAQLQQLADQVKVLSADVQTLLSQSKGTPSASLATSVAATQISSDVLVIDVLTIQKSLTVQGDSTIFGSLTVAKNADVQGEFSISKRQAGVATIAKGAEQLAVTYTAKLQNTPIVQATAYGEAPAYWISDSTNVGFTIRLATPASNSIPFAWTAITSKSPSDTTGGIVSGITTESNAKEEPSVKEDVKISTPASLEESSTPIPAPALLPSSTPIPSPSSQPSATPLPDTLDASPTPEVIP